MVDPNLKDIDTEIDAMMALIKEFLAVKYTNADTKYPPDIFKDFDSLFGSNWRCLLNGDDRVKYSVSSKNWFYLSHDLDIIYNNE